MADAKRENQMNDRQIVYLDSFYTYDAIRERQLDQFYESRHRGGYFHRVWGVSPLAGLLNNKRGMAIRIRRFSARQILLDGFIEGPSLPRLLVPLNVLWAQLRLLRALLRITKRPRVRALFATDPFYSGLLGLLLKKLTGKPLMIGVYANQDEVYAATRSLAYPRLLPWRFLEKAVERMVLTSADMIEAPTQNIAEYVVKNGAAPSKLAALPVVKFISKVHFKEPTERGDPRPFLQSRGVPLDRKYLIHVGRLLKLKHADDAIRAMKVVVDRDPYVIGLIAGTGPLQPEIERMIEEFGIQENIFLLGNLDSKTLSDITPHCVTLSPLTGMALIETSLAASPPVVYDRDWQPEFVKNGDSGYVVPYLDYEQMGEKALAILGNPELRSRFSRRIRADALALTDLEKHYRKEHEAFDRLVHRV